MSPQRVQLRRVKGWRMPPGVVKVDRTTRWGNPFVVGRSVLLRHPSGAAPYEMYADSFTVTTREQAVRLFRRAITDPAHCELLSVEGRLGKPRIPPLDEVRRDLAGKDLGCWCNPGDACHVDVLLELANGDA